MLASLRTRFVLLLALAVLLGPVGAAHAVQTTYIVVDHATGRTLVDDGADIVNYPASLTKMMTLYLTFDALRAGRLSLMTRLRVSQRAASQPPSKLGLRPGTTITVSDAIQALAVKSANDVAVVLAEALGGSEERFAQQMTRVARLKGLRSTAFRNASGLPHPGQVTTARDMAALARRLITDHPQYYAYFSQPSFSYAGRRYGNHNALLASYQGMDGLKTGYIRSSGYNLASSAVRGGRRLVGVVLGGQSSGHRNAVMAQALDDGFEALARGDVLLASSAVEGRPMAASTMAPIPVASAPVVTAPEPLARLQAPGSILQAKPALAAIAPEPLSGSAEGDADPSDFAVQVGAFARHDTASSEAAKIAALLPKLSRGAEVDVAQVRFGKTIYAARLTGFTRLGADRLCKELKRQKRDCLVVKLDHMALSAN